MRVRLVLLLAVLPPIAASAQQVTIPKSTISGRLRTIPRGDSLRIARASGVDKVAVAVDSQIKIRPGEVIVIPNRAHPMADTTGGAHVDLPNRYLTLQANSTALLNLGLRVSVLGGGLRFNPAQNAFTGDVLVGLEDSARPHERIRLSGPLEVQVIGDAEHIEPGLLRFTHTNVPFERVHLQARSPGDTLRVVVQPVFDPTGVPTGVPVIRSALRIRVSPARIQGFGLETATLSVSADDELRGRLAVLTTNSGRLAADTVRLTEGVALTTIRSAGWGPAHVEGEVGSVARGEVDVYYVFPWSFLVAGILGGAIGALVRMRRVGHREGRSFAADMALGSAAGLLAAVALALGVNLTGIDLNVRFGEAAVFLVSALGAALDLPALAPLRQKLARKRT